MQNLIDSDYIVPFMFTNVPVRGAIVKLSTSLETLFEGHDYDLVQKTLLSEFIAANVLMTTHLKLDGMISLQVKSEGKISLLTTSCSDLLNYRALLRSSSLGNECFASLFNQAILAITLEPNQGQRYQGLVALEGENLSESLSHYFLQSEQLPTQFCFLSTEQGVCGLMLQALPDTMSQMDDEWVRLKMLLSTLSAEEALELPYQDLLYRLFHEDTIKLFAQKSVNYLCGCSKARFERALLHLDHENLKLMLEEDGQIETECHFCLKKYTFDEMDILRLLQAGSQKSDH